VFNGYCGEFLLFVVLSRFKDSLFCRKPFTHLIETLFDSMQKSFNFLLEIMTLVSSANIMGIDEVFRVEGRSYIWIMKAEALKLTPGELAP
jgi:hypothetical protein